MLTHLMKFSGKLIFKPNMADVRQSGLNRESTVHDMDIKM